jgi:hypothetical protein
MNRAQVKYLALILSIALVFSCSKTFADERTLLHVSSNLVGTLALYEFLNLMGRAGCHPKYHDCRNTKEMLLIAVPAMLATGLLMEATQSMERNEKIDMGDVGANALGVGLGVGAVFAFDL